MTKIVTMAVILFCLSFGIYHWISSLPKTSLAADPDVPETSAIGEQLFWGKGSCHICHKMGTRGSALRGPNLGNSAEGPAIAERAELRAKELGLPDATAYLIQSIMQPAAFTVEGYRAEMPEVFKPPVSLFPSEIKAIIRYLQGVPADSTPEFIGLPLDYWSANSGAVEIQMDGNAENGRRLFFDENGAACASCHVAIDSGRRSGSNIGPDLSLIGQIRTPSHLYWKIIMPDSNIVSGYDEILIKTLDGRFMHGVLQNKSEKTLTLRKRTGETIEINTDDIAYRVLQQTSWMPGNYGDLLTPQEIRDIVSYLMSQ